jgi:hypothetical protein
MSFHDTENPDGGVNMEHVVEKPKPNESKAGGVASTHYRLF